MVSFNRCGNDEGRFNGSCCAGAAGCGDGGHWAEDIKGECMLRCRDHGLMWVTGLYRMECWSEVLQVRYPSWQVS